MERLVIWDAIAPIMTLLLWLTMGYVMFQNYAVGEQGIK